MEQCLFCKIAAGEIPSDRVYEDDMVLAFRDIHPQAPVHVLVIPKKHIASIDDLGAEDADLAAHLLCTIPAIARKLGLGNGYRVVSNCGQDACQSVRHLHFHILGGRQLGETMA